MDKTYKIQIYPSYEVGAQVKKFKTMLFNRIGEYEYFHSQPHISMISFEAESRWETELVETVRRSVGLFSRFHLKLSGFSHFYQNGTLFLQVEDQPYLQMLNRYIHQSLRQHASRKRMTIHHLNVYQTPHMTIGSALSPAELSSGFDVLMNVDYTAEFEVRHIKLLSFSYQKGTNELISDFELSGGLSGLSSANPEGPDTGPSGTMPAFARLFGGSSGRQLSLFGL